MDKGGDSTEISLGLDESNDLRAKLGLAPLRAKKEVKQGDSAVSYRSRDDIAAADAKREQLQARLSSAKRAREAAAAHSADATSAAHGGAADWVASMRRRKAARTSAPAATSAGGAKAVAARAPPLQLGSEDQDDFDGGIAVRHGVDDFQEGRSVVLTLADADVLEEGGDVLQNTQMLDSAKAALANERKGKLAKARGGSSYSRAGADSGGGMLSRWEERDGEAVTGTQAVLTASGALVPSLVKGDADATTDSAAADAVRGRLAAAASSAPLRMAADFMTPQEAAAAMPAPRNAKGKAAKAKKHKRNKRSRAAAQDEESASVAPGGFFQGAEGSLGGGGGAGAAMAAALMASAGVSDAAGVSSAVPTDAGVSAAKAKLLAASAGGGGGVNPLTKQRTYRRSGQASAVSDDEDAGDDWSVQLSSSLARAKAATTAGPAVPAPAQPGGGATEAGDVDVAAVAQRLAAARAARDAAKAAGDGAAAAGGGSGALVFSSTDEFKRRMEAARASSRPAAAAATGGRGQQQHDGEEEAPAARGDTAGGLEEQLAAAAQHVAADGSLTAEEGSTGGGAASALAFLRRTGALEPVKSRAHIAGRANDKLLEEGDDPAPGIQLKYHDAFGREMTTKEAFRHLNYKFHGYGSGKGKRDKKLKAYMDSVQASKKS